ncbi:MAG: DUF2252 family protein [Campylobacterota bacterium]
MQTHEIENSENFELLKKVMDYNSIDKFDIGNSKLSLMSTHPFIYLKGTSQRFFDIFFESLQYNFFDFKNVFKDKNLITACTANAHLANFGFTGYDSRFIINDFDRYLKGNPFMDILRYTSSLKLFVDDINHKNPQNSLEFEELENSFFKHYFNAIKKEQKLKLPKDSSFYKFYKKSKQKYEKKSQLNKYTKLTNEQTRVFNFDNKSIIDFSDKKKQKIKAKIKKVVRKDMLIKDVVRKKTTDIQSSHLNRYYILIQKGFQKEYELLEMKEQQKAVRLNFVDEFKNFFDIDLSEYIDKKPAKLHEKNINLILSKKFDKNLASLSYKEKSYLLKTDFDSKQSFDEVNIFKYLKEYIKFTAISLANLHIEGLKVQIPNFSENKTHLKEYKKIKKNFQNSMAKYEDNKNLLYTVKSMSKSLSSLIFEDYLLFTKQYNQYSGYIKGRILSKLEELKELEPQELKGILKEIINTNEYLTLLKSNQNEIYRKIYNLIDNEKYKVNNKTLIEYYIISDVKEQFLAIVYLYLQKQKPFETLQYRTKKATEFNNELEELKKFKQVF